MAGEMISIPSVKPRNVECVFNRFLRANKRFCSFFDSKVGVRDLAGRASQEGSGYTEKQVSVGKLGSPHCAQL